MALDLTQLQRISRLTPPVLDADGNALELKVFCRHCGARLDAGHLPPLSVTKCPECGADFVIPQYFAGYLISGFCAGAIDNFVACAYDPVLDRNVALKISKNAAATVGGVRLLDNARMLVLINLPGVMNILDAGVWNDYAFYVMPWMAKGTLADVLALPLEERFTLRQTLQMMVHLAEALAAAKKRRIGHYDLNPRNILVNAEWIGRLTNFRRNDEYEDYAGDPDGLVRFDGWRYFSPEVLTGGTPAYEDDVYSLGVTFYELLSGQYPFGAVSTPNDLLMAQQRQLTAAPLKGNPACNAEIAELILQMMVLTPSLRPDYPEIVRVLAKRLAEVL